MLSHWALKPNGTIEISTGSTTINVIYPPGTLKVGRDSLSDQKIRKIFNLLFLTQNDFYHVQ